MNFSGIGEAVVLLILSLLVCSTIGVAAIVYTIGHLIGVWG